MFTRSQLPAAAIDDQVAAVRLIPSVSARLLAPQSGTAGRLPLGFAHDLSRSIVGHGEEQFARARVALARWVMFDLGWVRIANPDALIEVGQIVSVEANTLGLWSLNLSRIVETEESPNRFGFVYATTARHVEQGEERFLIEFDPHNSLVHFELEAVSRPRHILAWIGYPVTRFFQRRFARDSHRRMREVLKQASS